MGEKGTKYQGKNGKGLDHSSIDILDGGRKLVQDDHPAKTEAPVQYVQDWQAAAQADQCTNGECFLPQSCRHLTSILHPMVQFKATEIVSYSSLTGQAPQKILF